jgi:gluconokinase
MSGSSIIVMGVSGSGKSTVGAMLAAKFNAKFIDGDDLHPRANIVKMAQGEPLNDDDRTPWLERIRDAAFSLEQKNEHGVIVCSALKKQYRDQIREGNKNLRFLFLDGDFDLISNRMRARKGHYMKETMVESQFAALERPTSCETDITTIEINQEIELVVSRAFTVLSMQLGEIA